MGRPRKDGRLLMDTSLRIPVTSEQKALIAQATSGDGLPQKVYQALGESDQPSPLPSVVPSGRRSAAESARGHDAAYAAGVAQFSALWGRAVLYSSRHCRDTTRASSRLPK